MCGLNKFEVQYLYILEVIWGFWLWSHTKVEITTGLMDTENEAVENEESLYKVVAEDILKFLTSWFL